MRGGRRGERRCLLWIVCMLLSKVRISFGRIRRVLLQMESRLSMDKPLLERTIDEAWRFLHRADLDNCHIELCVEDVSRILCLDESDRDENEVKETLASCGLPKNPLDKVMGVLFP